VFISPALLHERNQRLGHLPLLRRMPTVSAEGVSAMKNQL
jgi:hypothetical protein